MIYNVYKTLRVLTGTLYESDTITFVARHTNHDRVYILLA